MRDWPEGLLRAIDPVVWSGLSRNQEEAIQVAARWDSWRRNSVDIRLTLPLPFGRF